MADTVSARTRKALKDYREKTRESDRAGDDNAYIVESILDIIEGWDGKRLFKVKWFNFPPEAATLEPEDSVAPAQPYSAVLGILLRV